MEKWDNAFVQYGLELSINKAEYMAVTRQQQHQEDFMIGEQNIKQTNTFAYLGSNITSKNEIEADINSRISKYSKNMGFLYPLLREKEIPRQIKTHIYKTILQPILLYGSETWTLTERLKSKLQAAEMKALRLIMGVTRRDRKRNTYIRATLGVEPLILTIEKNQLRWYGHVRRRGPESRAKELMDWRPTEKRPRGRPRKRWIDGVKEVLHREGIGIEEAEQLCQDRNEWRRSVHHLSTDRTT